MEVAFTDESLNDVTQWLWSFGDGETSAEQHPAHLYADAGVTAQGTTQPLPAGTYQIICTIPGHFTAGQEGILRVTTG